MEKEFVNYEIALELKELGFDEPCFGYFDPLLGDYTIMNSDCINPKPTLFNHNSSSIVVSAPTFSQSFRWFREKYEIYSSINSFHCVNSIKPFGLQIDYFVKGIWNYYETNDELNFITHEEAELECLKKLIKIVKINKDE